VSLVATAASLVSSVVGMTAPYRVVAVSGSLHEPSKTTALVRAIAEAVAERAEVEVELIELTAIGPSLAGALRRDQLPAEVEEKLQAIEASDLLIVGSPVYRASFTGLFKHLFDFVGQYELVGKPVLLAATGGGERHALIIEHQLRPLFAFFQALTLPLGVYASDTDFDGYTIASDVLRSRIDLAADRALPLVGYAASRPAETLLVS
jgi:FMN reductase